MSIEIMKQALEALETCGESETYDGDMECYYNEDKVDAAITALRLAIEQAEKQEPVAWTTKGQINAMNDGFRHYIEARVPRFVQPTEKDVPLYTAPPQRQPDYVWCGCGDGIMPNTGAKCGTCASLDAAPPQRQPLTEPIILTLKRHEDGTSYTEGWNDAVKWIADRAHGIGGGE